MTASPEIAKAFTRWARAELAAHYASPCPDEVMDALVERAGEEVGALSALPAATGTDVALKLFPFILAYYEPKVDDAPMLPVFSSGDGGEHHECLLASALDDLRRISPEAAQAMAAPHRLRQR